MCAGRVTSTTRPPTPSFLFPCHSLTSFPATHSPLSLPLTHLFPCRSLTSFPATHSLTSFTSLPATHSPLSPRLTHLFPRDSLTSFPATHSPLSLQVLASGDTCDSLNALFSTQIQPLNPALTCSDGPRPGQVSIGADLHRNGSVFTHSYSLSLPTPPFSSISFSSPLPPSPRFLHTFISPLSPIFLLSLSPPSPPFASLSPFLLPLPLSPPSLPFSPLSPLSPSLPFSSLPPSQLLCVAFNQTPAELPAAVAGIWRRLSLALLPDESGPLVRCTAAVQPPAGQYDEKGELGCLCAVGGEASGETRSVCHRLPHALLPDESQPLVRLAAAAQPPAGQHDESGESERLFNAVSFSSPSILFLTDG
ncbi:unnamed protein product [Closterium sp. NIES-65]|nr:unnamed protein product [Closterium sp. NIES-65]